MNLHEAGRMLNTENLTKSFGNLKAVDNLNIQVDEGIHGLIGPNGAGKTTLFNLLTEILKPTSGEIYSKGENVTELPANERVKRGLVKSFQIPRVFHQMTVRDNFKLAFLNQPGENLRNIFFRSGKTSAIEKKVEKKAQSLIELLDLSHLKDELAGKQPDLRAKTPLGPRQRHST